MASRPRRLAGAALGAALACAGLVHAPGRAQAPAQRAAVLGRTAQAVRVQNVAGNVRPPGFDNALAFTTSADSGNCRSLHFNEGGAAVAAVQLHYPGWRLDAAESDLPSSYTLSASVEYPLGSGRQQVVSNAAVPPGPGLTTPAAALPTPIPAGAQFAVVTWWSVAAGSQLPNSGYLAAGETGSTGTGVADLTGGGTVTGAAPCLRPAAILAGVPKRLSLAGIGDSIMAGYGEAVTGAQQSGPRLGRGFMGRAAEGYPFLHMAVSGTKGYDQTPNGKFVRRAGLLQLAGVDVAVFNYSANDLQQGGGNLQTVASLGGMVATLAAAANGVGARAVWTTSTPNATSTDGFRSLAAQAAKATPTGQFAGGPSSTRSGFNAWVRGVPSPLWDTIEVADAVESARDSGLWAVPDGTNARLGPAPLSGTAGAGATTTSVPSDIGTTANLWINGVIKFTSGANGGAFRFVAANTAGGTFTTAAFAAVPAPGDTFQLFRVDTYGTADGIHPGNVFAAPYQAHGGVLMAYDAALARVQAWAAR